MTTQKLNKIKVPLAVKSIFGLALLIFLKQVYDLFKCYSQITQEVIRHRNWKKPPDGYDSKEYLLLHLATTLVLLLLILFVIYKPNVANYPVKITQKNKEKAYKFMQYFLAILALAISLIFYQDICGYVK